MSDELLLAQCRRSGQFPNYTRPKSTEPILVDPKQRKRLGGDDNNYSDLQNVDENDAMRMALTASRSDNSRYQSLELDANSDSSEDENSNLQHNPFDVPSIYYMNMNSNPFSVNTFEYNTIEANPFSNPLQIVYDPQSQMIENPFMLPQVN